MEMGSVPIVITDASREYHRLLLTGENFTEYSVIYTGDQALDTAYIDSTHLIARVADDAIFDSVTVAQVAKDGAVLGQTEAFELEQ